MEKVVSENANSIILQLGINFEVDVLSNDLTKLEM
jgi:hypothetical protein